MSLQPLPFPDRARSTALDPDDARWEHAADLEPSEALVLEATAAVARLIAADPDDDDAILAHALWSTFEDRLRRRGDSPLARLAEDHGLDSFELRVLALGLAMEVQPSMSKRVGRALSEGRRSPATVRVAVERLSAGAVEGLRARRAFLPSGRLVARGLLTVGPPRDRSGDTLLDRAITVPPAVVRHVLGEPALPGQALTEQPGPPRRDALLDVVLPAPQLEALRRTVEPLASEGSSDGLVVVLTGPAGTGKSTLVRAVGRYLGQRVLTVRASDLPETPAACRAALADHVLDARLRDAVLVLDRAERAIRRDDVRAAIICETLEGFDGLAFVVAREVRDADPGLAATAAHRLGLTLPAVAQRRDLWAAHLPLGVEVAADVDLDGLARRYELTGAGIRNAIDVAVRHMRSSPGGALTTALLERACREQLPRAEGSLTLSERSRHTLRDIALAPEQERAVREVIAACRNQGRVLDGWGFGERLPNGKGISVLLDGPPGTGKSFCAAVIAGELGQPLMRVNLAEVTSKWAGETEKHVCAIFAQARACRGVLLFDEADALLASRVAETRTGADRHANTVVNLLLQELERFEGVAVLTTNLYGALDDALVRRIQHRITLDEPGPEERARIWRVLCPPGAPLADDVDFGRLGEQLEMTGGMIKNALLRAAYRACEAGRPIDARTIVDACGDEFRAAGRVMRLRLDD